MELSLEPESIAMTVFRQVYKHKKARPPEKKKPRLKWFPKYRTQVNLRDDIINDPNPFDKLEEALLSIGFKIKYWTKEAVFFSRGKAWGDFSAKLIKLTLSISTPLSKDSLMQLEVADVCLFDTGDLWKVTSEIVQILEEKQHETDE